MGHVPNPGSDRCKSAIIWTHASCFAQFTSKIVRPPAVGTNPPTFCEFCHRQLPGAIFARHAEVWLLSSGCNGHRYRGYDCDETRIIPPPPSILANHRQTSQFTIAAQSTWDYILHRMWAIGARIVRRLRTFRSLPRQHNRTSVVWFGQALILRGRGHYTCEELRDVRNGVDGCGVRFG
jgi:hypothetical protein